jgi:hypothetical protein
MSPEAYLDILVTHGRRVANRVVLSTIQPSQRKLSDFYACYAPEDTLPEDEQSQTGMIDMFDPCGAFVYYRPDVYPLWPEPKKERDDNDRT